MSALSVWMLPSLRPRCPTECQKSPRLSNSNSTCSEAKHTSSMTRASHGCVTEVVAPPLPALRTRPQVPAKPADAKVPGFLGPTCPPLRSHQTRQARILCPLSQSSALHHTRYQSSVLTTSLNFQPSVYPPPEKESETSDTEPVTHKPLDHLAAQGSIPWALIPAAAPQLLSTPVPLPKSSVFHKGPNKALPSQVRTIPCRCGQWAGALSRTPKSFGLNPRQAR